MAATFDSKYLFVGSCQDLIQYRIDDHELVKEYPLEALIFSVVTTYDNRHVFAGQESGSVHQICIETQKVIKCYPGIDDTTIYSMTVTRDSEWLITCNASGKGRKISIGNQQPGKDFRKICKASISNIVVAPGDENLFVYDRESNLKLIDLADGMTIKYFRRVHYSEVPLFQMMLVTRDGQHIFTSSIFGGLKQWSVRERAMVADLSAELDYINCLCD
jgi:hypothetical protein